MCMGTSDHMGYQQPIQSFFPIPYWIYSTGRGSWSFKIVLVTEAR